MDNRVSRWSCLTIFAAINLVFWLGMALAVGLTASDGVDLGVETFLRERQATAVAIWKGFVARGTALALTSTPPAPTRSALAPTQGVRPTDTLAWPTTPSPEAPDDPQPPTAGSPPAPQPSPTPQPTQRTGSDSSSGGSSAADLPTAPPSPTPIASPLLMADPELERLLSLAAEMSGSAVGRPVQIRYREATLNEELTSLLLSYPDLPYRDVQVDLNRDQIILSGQVTVMGFEVDTEVLGRVIAQACRPQVDVQEVRIAGVLTPGFIKEAIKDLVLESMDWYPANYPLCLEQIVLEEGRLTVYGSRR